MLRAAVDHYRRQQRLTALAVAAGRRAWRLIDPVNLNLLGAFVAALLPMLVGAQRTAAQGGADYVGRAVVQQRIRSRPVGVVYPDALAGVSADGRSLATLLIEPTILVKQRIGAGSTVGAAMATGLSHLDMIMRTEVADAGRVAAGIGIAATPGVGYVRMLNLPSCARCVLLAGVAYEWNAGFERHPNCDCIHIPADEDTDDDLRTDPMAYFGSLTTAEQDRIFTTGGAAAIRDGADIGQVVNARRGMYTAGGRRLTREGATRRGFAGMRLGAPRGGRPERLMPEQIYREANGSRTEAIRLLRTHGYLI